MGRVSPSVCPYHITLLSWVGSHHQCVLVIVVMGRVSPSVCPYHITLLSWVGSHHQCVLVIVVMGRVSPSVCPCHHCHGQGVTISVSLSWAGSHHQCVLVILLHHCHGQGVTISVSLSYYCIIVMGRESPSVCPSHITASLSWAGCHHQCVLVILLRHCHCCFHCVCHQEDFYQFDKYLSYTWALEKAERNRQGVTVTFSARSLTVKPGRYCLCYLTKKYSLMGISNVFQVRGTKKYSLMGISNVFQVRGGRGGERGKNFCGNDLRKISFDLNGIWSSVEACW